MTKMDSSKEFEAVPSGFDHYYAVNEKTEQIYVFDLEDVIHRASQELVRDTLERLMKTEGEAVTYKIDGSHGWAVPIGRLDAELAQLKQEGEKHE